MTTPKHPTSAEFANLLRAWRADNEFIASYFQRLPTSISMPISISETMITHKTCTRCLGRGKIITNAGTGLKADCPKCKPTNQKINGHHHDNGTNTSRKAETGTPLEQDAG